MIIFKLSYVNHTPRTPKIITNMSTIDFLPYLLSNKISDEQILITGTPQESKLSPLLFIILMADLNLWSDSILSNFADDTQSVIISDSREKLIETI